MAKWQYTKGLHDLGNGCFAYLQPDGSWGWSNAGLIVDHDQQSLIKVSGKNYISYVEKFVPPWIFAKQHIGNSFYNMKMFLKNDFHMKSGMKYLIESFYKSIAQDTPLPITHKEILLTSRIMDAIFAQIYPS